MLSFVSLFALIPDYLVRQQQLVNERHELQLKFLFRLFENQRMALLSPRNRTRGCWIRRCGQHSVVQHRYAWFPCRRKDDYNKCILLHRLGANERTEFWSREKLNKLVLLLWFRFSMQRTKNAFRYRSSTDICGTKTKRYWVFRLSVTKSIPTWTRRVPRYPEEPWLFKALPVF